MNITCILHILNENQCSLLGDSGVCVFTSNQKIILNNSNACFSYSVWWKRSTPSRLWWFHKHFILLITPYTEIPSANKSRPTNIFLSHCNSLYKINHCAIITITFNFPSVIRLFSELYIIIVAVIDVLLLPLPLLVWTIGRFKQFTPPHSIARTFT